MSVNLTNSARLAHDEKFQDQIRAAMVERAIIKLGVDATDKVSRTALRDADYLVTVFARICADDAVISAVDWAMNETDIRRTVLAAWPAINIAVPNIGS